MSRLCCGVLTCVSMLWMVGCEDASSPDAAGVVSDSAGVRVVDLPGSRATPVRSLEVDMAWMQGMDLEVGRLGDVEPLPGGGAAVLDEMSGVVSILAPGGEVLLEFGRLGEGPGEFSPHGGISRVVATDSSLSVPDIQLQRITEFSMYGEVLAVHPMPELGPGHGPVYGVDWRAHSHGGIVFRALTPAGDLLLRAVEQDVDTLHVFEMPAPVPNRLLPPTPVWDLDPEGRVVVGRSDRGRIEMRVPGAESPIWVVRWGNGAREVSPEEQGHLEDLLVSAAEAQGLGSLPAEQRDRILSSVTFPESVPVVASVLSDPGGRVWIQGAASVTEMGMESLRVGSASGFGGNEWRVLAPDGLLEEVVVLPPGFSPRRFVGDCMYGILEDDLGVQRPARVCGG
jgi:hypothetical protein